MMLPFYHKHFINILSLGTVPNICCNGIIVQYLNLVQETTRRITTEFVFQVVSILNQRLLGHAVPLNVLHKSQIGFLPKNRTSDHFLTLRTVIDKCVHGHREKIHACFVNFKTLYCKSVYRPL